jgi:2-polyprenyl-3-methyl-5-hydroxy-6-metoxy-1,4-benzoquinol methylase
MRQSLKPFLKSVFRIVKSLLPARFQARLQTLAERVVFRFTADVHHLPPIFHYWSNRYLRPRFEAFGFATPDAFFVAQLVSRIDKTAPLRILALGSGRADLELAVGAALRDAGVQDFQIHGVDLTLHAVKDARSKAIALGMAAHFVFTQADLNDWQTEAEYDVVIANHCLHHVVQLEALFAQVQKCLARGNGLFLVADMIGRNGHQLWPEALTEVRRFWAELPAAKRFDRATGKVEPSFVNYDCAQVGFEGVRAQDILPLLCQRFEFELFLPYGGIVIPLIERRTGWNFNAENTEDLAFVDRLEAREQALFRELTIKPSQMLALMRPHALQECVLLAPHLTPQACVRRPDVSDL